MTICRSARWNDSDGGKKVIKVHLMIAVTQHCYFGRDAQLCISLTVSVCSL